MRVLGAFISIESSKVSIMIKVNTKIGSGMQDKTSSSSPFEIKPNMLQDNNMFTSRVEGVVGTLVDSKGNVTASIAFEVEEHANDTGIVDGGVSWFAICII